jgi:hypothetical protein
MKYALTQLVCAAGFAIVVLTSGCDTTPVHQARVNQTLVLSPEGPSPTVDVEVVTNLHVVLPGPEPGSGLIWEILANNTRVLEQTSAIRAVPPALPSEKSTTTVTFYSLRPGKSTLRFALVHLNEDVATPVAKCTALIRVTD